MTADEPSRAGDKTIRLHEQRELNPSRHRMSRREAAHRENEIESGGSVWHVLRCQIFMNTPPTPIATGIFLLGILIFLQRKPQLSAKKVIT
jgi:hypothetical protein